MTVKLWEVEKGRIVFLVHINSKSESRIVKLKEYIDCDNVQLLSDLDKAIELMTTFVTSVKKFGNTGIDEATEVKQLGETIEVEKSSNAEKVEISLVEKDEVNWAWGNGHDRSIESKYVPEEVDNKLSALLETDIGKPRGAQYLMHKNAKTDANKGKNNLSTSILDGTTNVGIVGEDDVGRKERKDGKSSNGGKIRSKYEHVVFEILPEILNGIENSADKTVTMKVSDILARMKEGISMSKSPGNIYTGLKLKLFAHNIVADQISLEETDAATRKKAKALVMRMRNEEDTLPGYILRNRSRRR